MVETYTCCVCKEEKSVTEFYSRNNKRGFRSECKPCFNQIDRKRRINKLAANTCRYCSEQRIKGSSYCLFHSVKLNCRQSNIPESLIPELILKLQEQNYSCFYTGRLLIPGNNLTIDHVIPVSKGGDNSLDNLVWCDTAVNRLKSCTSVEDFKRDYSSILEELTVLASLETPEQRSARLNYVLGLN